MLVMLWDMIEEGQSFLMHQSTRNKTSPVETAIAHKINLDLDLLNLLYLPVIAFSLQHLKVN